MDQKRLAKEEIWDKEAKTLGEVIYELIRAGKAQSEDFQSLLKFFGQEKIKSLYETEKRKEKR